MANSTQLIIIKTLFLKYFGILGENDDGRRMMELCAERRMCVGNTYFKHRSLHKYTRVARGRDGAEVKSMTNMVLVMKYMLRYV